jgi:hypothetical protein
MMDGPTAGKRDRDSPTNVPALSLRSSELHNINIYLTTGVDHIQKQPARSIP